MRVTQGADDDWETEADFVNDVSEREQRWGSRTVEGSGRVHVEGGCVAPLGARSPTVTVSLSHRQRICNHRRSLERLRQDVQTDDLKSKEGSKPNFSRGYGGKFGVEQVQDKVQRLDGSPNCHTMGPMRAGRDAAVGGRP